LLRAIAATAVVACFALALLVFPVDPAAYGGDGWNYLAAGERLNAGHPLYELSPGDRDVPLRPPYWTVPLLSPPLIAVIWRPLAALGDASMYLWWAGGFVACGALSAFVIRRATTIQMVAFVALSPLLALTAISGNASAYLVPLVALRLPSTVALAAAVKLSPILFAPSVGWRRVAGWLVVFAVASLVGAGVDNHIGWLSSVPSSAPSPASVSALTGLPQAVVTIGACALALLGWGWAAVGTALGTPVVYFSTLAFLVLAVAPRPSIAARRTVTTSPVPLAQDA
jgi:hypothetical protein